mmetsp:Transcript_38708/g.93964  ORF Transcript_38708/g.93964 Transcript_38708/m.93964 type:complete len:350 (-) Transcript_38708:398-1447(-)
MADAAVGARGDQTKPPTLALQPIGYCRHQARASRTEGVPNGQRAAMHVELLHGHRAHLGCATEVLLVELVGVQGFQIGEDLPGECLVELDHVDVLQSQPSLLEHLGGRVRGAEEKLLERITRDERPVAQEGLRLEPERERLLLGHEERRRGAVGEVGGVGGGDGAVRLDEGGLERRHLLGCRVATDPRLLGRALEGDDLVVEDARGVRLGRLVVRAQREVILLRAGHAELVRQPVAAVAHHLARGEVGDGGGLGGEVLQLQAGEEAQLLAHALRLVHREHAFPYRLGEANGHVAERLDASSNYNITHPSLDLRDARADRLVRGDARLRHRVRRRGHGQACAERRIARDV